MADVKPNPATSSFLQRWSLRKQEARRQVEETRDPAVANIPAVVSGGSDPESPVTENLKSEYSGTETSTSGLNPPDAKDPVPEHAGSTEKPFEQLDDNDMPPLDSLGEKSDYRAFFAPKVSAELRRLALRKLFHSPKFNIRDGLDDFDDDYTYFEPLGDTVTADMKHMQAVAQKRAELQAEKNLLSDNVKLNSVDDSAAAEKVPEVVETGVDADEDTANAQTTAAVPDSTESNGPVPAHNDPDGAISEQIAAADQGVAQKQTNS
ncbi:MAG: DUF3306 domain-containing protein [Gammaproteobacteria bacterium]